MWKLKGPSKFDYLLFISTITSSIIGLLMLLSYSWRNLYLVSSPFIYKQLVAFGLGLISIIFMIRFDYRRLKKYAYGIYVFGIVLLIMVLFIGKVARGARSWFSLGYFSFQPSEFISLALIIVLAKYIEKQREWTSIKQLFICFIYTLIPIILILLQPDFGTSLVLIPVFLGMVYLGKAQIKYIISLVLAGTIAGLISLFLTLGQSQATLSGLIKFFVSLVTIFANIKQTLIFLVVFFGFLVLCYFIIRKVDLNFPFKNVWFVFITVVLGIWLSFGTQYFLRDYQRQRVITFLNPKINPLGVGYNIIQSKIAIGSGGFLGKGILSGTQSQLGFVPEQHTDFIFSVIGEELGFIGAGLMLALLFIIVYRGVLIMEQAPDNFGRLLTGGVVCMFSFHAVLNIGMVMGIMPVVGVPLPLVSYGGSSLLAHMLAIGVLMGIHYRRFMY